MYTLFPIPVVVMGDAHNHTSLADYDYLIKFLALGKPL